MAGSNLTFENVTRRRLSTREPKFFEVLIPKLFSHPRAYTCAMIFKVRPTQDRTDVSSRMTVYPYLYIQVYRICKAVAETHGIGKQYMYLSYLSGISWYYRKLRHDDEPRRYNEFSHQVPADDKKNRACE